MASQFSLLLELWWPLALIKSLDLMFQLMCHDMCAHIGSSAILSGFPGTGSSWKCQNCWCVITGVLRGKLGAIHVSRRKTGRNNERHYGKERGRERKEAKCKNMNKATDSVAGKSQRCSLVVCRFCFPCDNIPSCQSYPASVVLKLYGSCPPAAWVHFDIKICAS